MPKVKKNREKVSKATKMYVKKVLDATVEDKQQNVIGSRPAGDAGMSWTGTVEPLVLIAQGVTNQTRIGSAILVRKLTLRLGFRSGAANATIRYLVVREKSGNGVVPLISEILDGPPATVNAPMTGYSFNHSSNKFFEILLDRTVVIDTAGPQIIARKHVFNKIGKIGFIGTAADQASLGARGIYLVTCSSIDPATVNEPAINYMARTEFEDA